MPRLNLNIFSKKCLILNKGIVINTMRLENCISFYPKKSKPSSMYISLHYWYAKGLIGDTKHTISFSLILHFFISRKMQTG